ncbi:Serpin domain, partial [Dillenia turbinata]
MAMQLLVNDAEKGSNLVFSPLSFQVMLSLIAAGAKGSTLQQLLLFLGVSNIADLHLQSSHIVSLASPDNNAESILGGPLLSFVNSAWIDKQFPLKPSFEEIAKVLFKAEARGVDFAAKDATKGLIKELIPSGCLNSDTALVLANALYFKGAWNRIFDASKTESKEFHLLTGEAVEVPFMTSKRYEKHLYRETDKGFKILKIPYQRKQDPTLHRFWIPRFKFSYGFEASGTLKELGLDLPFRNVGELTGIIDSVDSHKICLSEIFHKSYIEVNEEGTEAAASTAPRIIRCSGRLSPPTFVADHPFLFMIREDTTRTMFFIGAVLNPRL